jgi:hypothetical protein
MKEQAMLIFERKILRRIYDDMKMGNGKVGQIEN